MEYPTKEQIIEAASVSEEAKTVLEKLFPGVFEENKYFNLKHLAIEKSTLFSKEKAEKSGLIPDFMQIRGSGEYKNKAFFLDNCYNWEIIKDSGGTLCLIPTKK